MKITVCVRQWSPFGRSSNLKRAWVRYSMGTPFDGPVSKHAEIGSKYGPMEYLLGTARFGDSAPIIMDAEQTVSVCQAAPHAKVVAVHLEALDHCTTSRADLRNLAENHGISLDQLRIPADGKTISF